MGQPEEWRVAGTLEEVEQQMTDAKGCKITHPVIKGYFTQDTNSLLASKPKIFED